MLCNYEWEKKRKTEKVVCQLTKQTCMWCASTTAGFEANCWSACVVFITYSISIPPKLKGLKTATSSQTLYFSQACKGNHVVCLVLDIISLGVYIPICLQSDMPHTDKDLLKAMHFDKCVCCITKAMPSSSHTYSCSSYWSRCVLCENAFLHHLMQAVCSHSANIR